VNSVAYSPDGRHIISGSDDKLIDPFYLILMTSSLEPHGPNFLKVHLFNLFVPLNSAHVVWFISYSPVSAILPIIIDRGMRLVARLFFQCT
jgi:hypothetical protein